MKAKVIMLEDSNWENKEGLIGLLIIDVYGRKAGDLLQSHRSLISIEHYKPHHIYLTDPNAEIKEGDYYIMDDSLMEPVEDQKEADRCNIHPIISPSCSKIIATTNKLLIEEANNSERDAEIDYRGNSSIPEEFDKHLPQLSEQSIKLLIDYYNKYKKMPDEVKLVGTHWIIEEKQTSNPQTTIDVPICKVNTEGTVDITISEERTYTKEEVISLAKDAFEDSCKYTNFKEWINENL